MDTNFLTENKTEWGIGTDCSGGNDDYDMLEEMRAALGDPMGFVEKLMEAAGLVGDGTVIVADNVIYPGAPDFLEYVDTSRGRYKTTLLEAAEGGAVRSLAADIFGVLRAEAICALPRGCGDGAAALFVVGGSGLCVLEISAPLAPNTLILSPKTGPSHATRARMPT